MRHYGIGYPGQTWAVSWAAGSYGPVTRNATQGDQANEVQVATGGGVVGFTSALRHGAQRALIALPRRLLTGLGLGLAALCPSSVVSCSSEVKYNGSTSARASTRTSVCISGSSGSSSGRHTCTSTCVGTSTCIISTSPSDEHRHFSRFQWSSRRGFFDEQQLSRGDSYHHRRRPTFR
ncbi:hypothetical protein VOLCADRAFT_98047 [Volvox carteri f. nagariensis]|uniref:Uncharacterized protein n=1 Tax=Volvox carteri f. nagariensis TaxID=3068 RepID=D8UEB0_VOLCA|nr:uncharacterized protein VOLCADRAFT_98047 [Volvox carteri f. nagariensis]EFJ41938.1 hypothetical protein VOLCADRAFT_98047 [Volvox carteri f. nagariensis]|eukprot:XP_002956975.1 hypothetical protein VOLCADRAFT_98047 [Volvox carteri f. nagariensis]